MTNQRFITILGYVATFTSVCMYVSYLQQIGLNLSGQKGGWLPPFATTINCSLWVAYGLLKEKTRSAYFISQCTRCDSWLDYFYHSVITA